MTAGVQQPDHPVVGRRVEAGERDGWTDGLGKNTASGSAGEGPLAYPARAGEEPGVV
jgi:hypothetical protein